MTEEAEMNVSHNFAFCFYVPEDDAETVKSAVFEAGGGRIGDYDCCSWQTAGTGQFRALEGSNPYIGEQDQLEKVKELKVEFVVSAQHLAAVEKALLDSHPYETPAYFYWKINGILS